MIDTCLIGIKPIGKREACICICYLETTIRVKVSRIRECFAIMGLAIQRINRLIYYNGALTAVLD